MKELRYSLVIALVFSTSHLFSQDTIYFKKGLMISAPAHYGREAIVTDELAYRLYTNELKRPVEGEFFGKDEDGKDISWQPLVADSLNRLRPLTRPDRRRRRFGGDYIYLTYNSDKKQPALLHVKGNSFLFLNGELHTGDPYSSGWLYIPVQLKKGLNELFIRGYFQTTASLIFPKKQVSINTEDATLPFVVLTHNNNLLHGAIVVLNTSGKELKNLQIKSNIEGRELITPLPAIPSLASRKISFDFDAGDVSKKDTYNCNLTLLDKGKVIDQKIISIEAVDPSDHYSETFTSDIDGSLQYYAVTPQSTPHDNAALFLSVHGAGVEAIGQARAYHSKDWGTLVAATNRRPRGFNWEDWGRLDALEVLNIAKKEFHPDPQHIYLTGHSMGGHGTWFLGATYPDKWAAIGACSGYPTLKEYGSADGLVPDSSKSLIEQVLLRAGNQSDVIKLAHNYKAFGVYILHGDSDKVVPVKYARQMRKVLGDFQADFSYYEYPGGEHWFGNQSVDWKPLFDFFKWHSLPVDTAVNSIDFTTASPGISANYHWVSIQQQIHPLELSHIQLLRNKLKNNISGATENIHLLKMALNDFNAGSDVNFELDNSSLHYKTVSNDDTIFLLHKNNQWSFADRPSSYAKNPQRYGTFKEAFNHKMIFVYGTSGNKQENEWNYNKATYDAETWYYRGNGAVAIIPDKEYSIEKYAGRNVIIYGNASSNSAWKSLLADCPITVTRSGIKVGDKTFTGDDLGAYFVWPMKNLPSNSIGVIAGTGINGMNAANPNQYFAGASGFPDFMIFRLGMLQSGANRVEMAGFFDNNWKLAPEEMVSNTN
ncbi:prolyl oligopeptidase family serine peptidase [Ginsengibacter hankyongi]|uniref:Prolyl oligopeptidase family serine peptidase n=1 Tax=Ginsengibacter hankyongi TaxID=2607284 RepID=A0A5J5IC89_9BACT|nr:alpha/beta hydrolase-fold protein [Ginsengibacter hankyongi]KAA9035697.1 prolyl oligopeptidase family serine peptidase [Ginsengibacter hankyongi]